MNPTPKHQPIPDDLQNLKPPTRADAIAYTQRGWHNEIEPFERTVRGQQCAKGMYSDEQCRTYKADYGKSVEKRIQGALEALQLEYARKRERRAAIEAENTAAFDAEIAILRERYLRSPGTTDADFERDLPEILRQRRVLQALEGQTASEAAIEAMRGKLSL